MNIRNKYCMTSDNYQPYCSNVVVILRKKIKDIKSRNLSWEVSLF